MRFVLQNVAWFVKYLELNCKIMWFKENIKMKNTTISNKQIINEDEFKFMFTCRSNSYYSWITLFFFNKKKDNLQF